MIRLLPILMLGQVVILKDDVPVARETKNLNFSGTPITCVPYKNSVKCTVTSGGGAPVDGGYIFWGTATTGSTNERKLATGNYTTIDVGTAGEVQVDWAHGQTCGAGQALTSAGTTAMGCTSTGAGHLKQVVTSNVTNSTTSPATITGLTWTAKTGVEQGFHCVLLGQGTATALPRYNINGPTQTHIAFTTYRFTTTSARTLLVLQAVSASAQTAACTSSCNTTILPTEIWGAHLPSADGTMSVQVTSSTAGQTVTVYRGSFCEVF